MSAGRRSGTRQAILTFSAMPTPIGSSHSGDQTNWCTVRDATSRVRNRIRTMPLANMENCCFQGISVFLSGILFCHSSAAMPSSHLRRWPISPLTVTIGPA